MNPENLAPDSFNRCVPADVLLREEPEEEEDEEEENDQKDDDGDEGYSE
jgi:hypothetical protein